MTPENLSRCYDLIMDLQQELEEKINGEFGPDYRAVKALAASYELQDYLADRISRAVSSGELEPEIDY